MTRRGTWGGARRGAGRPRGGARASEPHKTRPPIAPAHPVHVTARVVAEVGDLARRAPLRAIERAVTRALGREDFRIVHVALGGSRLDLIVEADDKRALARGMQGFQVAAARYLNAAVARRGGVFPDRYRARVLASRAAVRTALARLPRARRWRAASPEVALLRAAATPRRRARRSPRARAS